ncbi:DUF3889 domain-containing protein [Paenibacillus gansuensis]|uniref:DUF3889 domain-containing protein n=1 Tax=Paenibacillus gansuensis TaxID=306542 RepID=A0ABW5PDQ6_9BACL
MRLFPMLLILSLFAAVLCGPAQASQQPSYAKWGQLAVKETQKAYAGAPITDYLYMGRTILAPNRAQEKFKLIVRKGTKLVGVLVTVTIELPSEKFVSILLRETSP